MAPDPDLAAVGALLADRSRAAMLEALLEGAPLAAGDLARRAGVSLATASSHLARLVAGGLVAPERSGRFRFFRLAGADVVRLLEAVAVVAPAAPALTSDAQAAARALRDARTCYDHLAGRLGVAVTDALVRQGRLRLRGGRLEVRPALEDWLARLGRPPVRPEGSRRPDIRTCIDWSERRPHVAGLAGAAVAGAFLAEGWVVRVRRGRALRLTDRGRAALARELGLTVG